MSERSLFSKKIDCMYASILFVLSARLTGVRRAFDRIERIISIKIFSIPSAQKNMDRFKFLNRQLNEVCCKFLEDFICDPFELRMTKEVKLPMKSFKNLIFSNFNRQRTSAVCIVPKI